MNTQRTGLTALLLLLSCAASAGEMYSKTYERPEGPLTVSWGPPPAMPHQGQPDFDALDSNGDGRLNLAETESHRLLHSDFIYADGNRDGGISRKELARWK